MVDPVFADDGNTYERFEILKWIALKSTSPLDHMAKQLIEEV
jgi:hypothetical protein